MLIRILITIHLMVLSIVSYSQVSNGNMEDVVVCGESTNWEVITTAAGTLIIDELPPGFSFVGLVGSDCGATLTASSPPTFSVPAACTITYSVEADCEAFRVRDDAQGGNSDLVFKIDFTFNGNNIAPQDVTGETNAPELQIELIENGTPVAPFTSFVRKFRVCNDGLDSYMIDSLEICFDNGADLVWNGASLDDGGSGIPLTVVGNCVKISPAQYQFSKDRAEMASGTDPMKLEGGSSVNNALTAECVYIDLELELNSCAVSPDFTQTIKTNWGCDGETCAIEKSLPINSNISQEAPNLILTSKLDVGDGCNKEHLFTDTIYIRNIGAGAANNIYLLIEDRYLTSTLWAFDAGNIMLDDGVNAPYLLPVNNRDTSRMNYAGTDGAACVDDFYRLGGIENTREFDVNLPIAIEPGQTIKLIVPMYFCCVRECFDGSGWDRWMGSMDYTDFCGSTTFNVTNKIIQSYFHARNRTSPNIATDYNDGDTGEIVLDVNDFSFDTYYPNLNWPTRPYYELTFPCGFTFDGNAAITLNDDFVLPPDSLSWDPMTGILYMDWIHPFSHGNAANWLGGQVKIGIAADCAPCGGGTKTFGMEGGYRIGIGCNEGCKIGNCYNFSSSIHCGGCPWTGITADSYDIVRTSYGLTDANDDGLPDDGSVADPSNIRIDRATVGDTIEGTWHANVTNDASHPFWEYGYARTDMLGTSPSLGYAKPIGGRIAFFDVDAGDTIYCENVPFTIIDYKITDFDYSPSSLCALGCPDFCGRVYEQDDEIWLTGIYVVEDPNICNSAVNKPITVKTELYGAEIANPPPNTNPPCADCNPIVFPDNRYTCDTYTGAWSMITPFNTIASTASYVVNGCTDRGIGNSFYHGIGPGSSYHFNLFPREYRPFAIWDTLYVAIPEGYVPGDFILNHRYGTGNGNTTGGAKSRSISISGISPDFIDMSNFGGTEGSTVYGFNTKQYFDDNTFLISDDGGIISISTTIEATCNIENGQRDTIEYWGKPRWRINDQVCGLFGPRSPDYLTLEKPVLTLQSEQITALGDCPEEDWPVRIVSSNNAETENAFFYIPTGTLQIDRIENTAGDALPENNNIYEIGSIAGPSAIDYTIFSNYLTCDRDSFLVLLGSDCEGVPNNIADYGCALDSLWLFLEPKEPDFNLAILQPTSAQQYGLCDPVTFEFQYRNVGEAKAYNLRSRVFLPQDNADIQSGSLEIEYPCGTGYQPWQSAYPTGRQVPLGTLWAMNITRESKQNANINLIGDTLDDGWVYPLISEVDNCFNVRFNVTTSCGFKSSQQAVRTTLVGTSPCGIYGDPNGRVVAEIENATAIEIMGTNPYSVALNTTVADTILACSGNQMVDVSLEMLDPGPTGPIDSIEVRLPSGMTYVSNTTTQTPQVTVTDGLTSIILAIDPPLNQNEVFNYSIEFAVNKDSLDCSDNTITANSFTIEGIQCTTAPPGELCNVYSTTGYSESNFYVDKPALVADILFANTSCSSGSMDLNYAIEITNNSMEDIPASEDFTVDVYTNLDGSCSIFGNSQLVKTLTVNGPIAAGASVTITDDLIGFQVEACNLITKVNGCACDNGISYCEEIILGRLPGNTYADCYPNTVEIETCNRPEFTYTWSGIAPATTAMFTTATDIYNPTVQLPDPGFGTQTYQFEVNIDRGSGCRVNDTVSITVYPLIDENYSGTNEICNGLNTQLHADAGLTGTWIPTTNLDDPNDPQTVVNNPTYTTPVEYVFEYTDGNGCAASFREEVTVLECIDLELAKNIVTTGTIRNGDLVQFELILMNTSAYDATNIEIVDVLPPCLTYNFNFAADAGTLNYSLDVLTWSIPTLASGNTATIIVDVLADDIGNCTNSAQVNSADQLDIDSSPANDDGNQSEDDEDNASLFICNPNICLPVTINRK